MQEARYAELASLCHVPAWTCGAALLYVLVVQQRGRETVGEVLHAQRSVRVRVARMAPAALALVGLFVGCAVAEGSEELFDALVPAFECLVLGVVLAWCMPCVQDCVVGREGVQVGWAVARWEEVEGVRVDGGVVWVSFEGRERGIVVTAEVAAVVAGRVGRDAIAG